MRGIALILLLGISTCLAGQSGHSHLRYGDRLYDDQAYEAAEEQYRNAVITDRGNAKGLYNLGNTLYMQERMKEAINQYERYAEQTSDSSQLYAAHYNAGNAYYSLGDYQNSVEAYKKALKLQPDDMDAKKNLMMAMSQMRQQQQQQRQQDQSEDQQEKEQQDGSSGMADNQQDQPQPPPPQDGEKKEAEELLDIVEREDQRVQEKLRKANSQPKNVEKEW